MYTNNFHLDIIGVEMQNQTRMGGWVGGRVGGMVAGWVSGLVGE